MTDNRIEKIRAEIKKLKSNLIHGACSSQVAMETRCKEEAYNEMLALLTMQEEPVSKVWHDASEDPKSDKDIAVVTREGFMWSRYKIENLDRGWKQFVNDAEIDKWAYVSDLINL